MAKIEKKRLLKLANFLRTKVKDEKFDLGSWATPGFSPTKCGTTACAMGWTPTVFPRANMQLISRFGGFGMDVTYYTQKGNFLNLGAAEKFYGLSTHQARYLFIPSTYHRYKGRIAVANRIEKFVREDGKCPEYLY